MPSPLTQMRSPGPTDGAVLPGSRVLQVGSALAAGAAVAIGAMGAHAFREAGDARGADLMALASQYLMWHALAALALSRLAVRLQAAITVLLTSAVLFAGTLVLLALGAPSWLGAVTPLGGTGLIIGWLMAAWALLRRSRPA
ncbi:DUF423 domain-containing protein [Geminicoccus flavidas]|uniref:DUF423 domain-containing protein n=1 Tax=Geminicoccus flavidas TaxID=2506407 RepID=UPI00190F7046|nr:DUF423 domain-containing protein [Geminicoccus flavidas]